jgi:hypothetical protein
VFSLLINLPEFPNAPWQKIRPSRRAKCKHLLCFYNDLDRIRGGLREESWNNVRNAIENGDLITKFGEIVPFLIDWRGGVQKVITGSSDIPTFSNFLGKFLRTGLLLRNRL